MSANFTFTCDKNMIYFLAEGKEKPYSFDINTGIFYGMMNKPVKNFPSGFFTWLDRFLMDNYITENKTTNNVFLVLNRINNYPNYFNLNECTPETITDVSQYFIVANRLENIGYHFKNSAEISVRNLQVVDKQFKTFVKYIHENSKGNLQEFCYVWLKQKWFEEFGLNKDTRLSNSMKDTLYDYSSNFSKKEIPYAIYYLSHGLIDFYQAEEDDRGCRDMMHKMMDYFKLCRVMDSEPEKNNFFRIYIDAVHTYNTNKKSYDRKAVKAFYAQQPALSYENENLQVVIPTTAKAFKAEGEAQHNCVYNSYWPSVKNMETYVVFIRDKKNLEKSYITCEVDLQGRIVQYLTTCNAHVRDEIGKQFFKEYTKHLAENWEG